MDIKTKMVLGLFNNNDYFEDMKEYLTEKMENKELTFQNLTYLYARMYIGKSEFIRQNIYPVSEFLIKGYSTQEAEKIAELLPDANDLTIFSYEEKEKGHTYNKLFRDLQFAYNTYDEYIRIATTKERALEIIEEEIQNTDPRQRDGEVQMYDKEFDSADTTEFYDDINSRMDKLKEEFKMLTLNDDKLVEHFKDTSSKDSFSSIMVAGTILAGIEMRNLQKENNNLDGEMEVFPYNAEQIKMIDKYNRLQETIDKIEEYAEQNFSEEDELEM